MKGLNLMDAFGDFKELKNIDRETMNQILDDVFRSMILKRWGADDGFDIIINPDRGDLEIWRTREIVPDGELDDEVAQIEVSMAQKIVPDLEIGEELIEEIKIEDFGRRNILAMRQNLQSRIMDLEKITSIRNTVNALETSSQAKCIRYGRKKCSYSMMRTTS